MLFLLSTSTSAQTPIQFHNAFDGSLLDVSAKPGEEFTEAVKTMHATDRNTYIGNPAAIAAGKKLYDNWCQSCHLPDGTGRIGPSLVGDDYTYERVSTDAGMFEVIYGGAGGAMQAFSKRISQDEILKIIAYVRSLRKRQ
jgi:cytochrome c-L